MSRRDDIIQAIDNDIKLLPLVDDMVYLEGELDRLRDLPKIMVHPKDPSKQKATPAAKLYKEYLQQYVNVVKVLIKSADDDGAEDESPLRKWMNDRCK